MGRRTLEALPIGSMLSQAAVFELPLVPIYHASPTCNLMRTKVCTYHRIATLAPTA